MFTADDTLTLSNFGEGAVNEIFDRELQRVLKDIMDPNTEATAQREVNLKIIIKPGPGPLSANWPLVMPNPAKWRPASVFRAEVII